MSETTDDLNDNSLLEKAAHWLRLGKLDDAEIIYKELISRHLEVPELFINLAAVYRAQGRFSKAAETLRQALKRAPDHTGAHYNLANIQAQMKRVKSAQASYLRCLSLAPEFVDCSINYAQLLLSDGKQIDAKKVLIDALGKNANDPRLLNNLGNICKDLGLLVDAEKHLRRATEFAPDNGSFKRNLGAVYSAQGRHKDAIEVLNLALKNAPDDADIYCLRAFALLALGRFDEGWEDYAWRWNSIEQEVPRPFLQSRWDGTTLTGKSILIWGEQGIGDEIMYASILADVLKSARQVTLECEPRLVPVFARSFPSIQVIARKNKPDKVLLSADFDFQAPIADLARFMRKKRSNFGPAKPFLKFQVEHRNEIRKRYQDLAPGRRMIGLSWKSKASRTGAGRSFSLDDLAPLSRISNAFFVCLQYGEVDKELELLKRNHNISVHKDPLINQMKDMDEFTAQVAAMDLVVSVANTTVHVAGGLGVPTRALIPGVADWRWAMAGDNSHWYPSVRLHRKTDKQSVENFMEQLSDCINFKFAQ